MLFQRKLLVISALLTTILPLMGMPIATAQTVPSSLTIVPQTCGLVITPGTINYGSLAINQNSTEVQVKLNNTGTTAGNVTLTGTHWKDSGAVTQMNSNVTKYGTPGTTYAAKPFTVQTTPNFVTTLGSHSAVTYAFQVKANLINPSFSGNLTQTLTFTSSC